MNKPMFYTGITMVSVQVIGIVLFLISSLDYSWLTEDLIVKVIGGLVVVGFNVVALILMVIGAWKNG